YYVICLFFFSSRRRHTRFSRDWSSDVCSSDLITCESGPRLEIGVSRVLGAIQSPCDPKTARIGARLTALPLSALPRPPMVQPTCKVPTSLFLQQPTTAMAPLLQLVFTAAAHPSGESPIQRRPLHFPPAIPGSIAQPVAIPLQLEPLTIAWRWV